MASSPVGPQNKGSDTGDLRSIGFSLAERYTVVPPLLTREFYIRRIAIALLLTGGKDPKHPAQETKHPGPDGKDIHGKSPCWCRICRAWICIRNTPAPELEEAKVETERLKGPPWPDGLGCIDDRPFL